MTAAGYNRILLGLVLGFVALAAYLALTLEPIDGDLTRVGGLSERAHGWRGEKQRFVPQRFRYHQAGTPIASAEVVVLGDSFSHQAQYGFGWQNDFAARTGLDLLVYDLRRHPALEILDSPALRQHPPRLVIFQSSELSLPERLERFPGDCTLPRAHAWTPLDAHPQRARTEPFARRISWGAALKPRIDQAMHVIKLRAAGLWGEPPVAAFRLARADLFTSRDPGLLVYGYAVPTDDWRSLDTARLACGLRNLESAAERTLGVPLVPLLAPNKLSAYADLIPGAPPGYRGFIPAVVARSGLPVPALRQRLLESIAAGARDVYLPNDSHWSDLGHRIASQALYDFLLAQGLLRVPPETR